MRYATRATTGQSGPGHSERDGAGETVDQFARYGVAVRDIFSDASWSPVEQVRARDWRDTGDGVAVSSETAFD